jgi:CheY-like chemotaxis protein
MAVARGGTGYTPGLSLTFLVVNDDSALRAATVSYLRDEGFDVIEAADVDEALRLLEHTVVDAVCADVATLGRLNGPTPAPARPATLLEQVEKKLELAQKAAAPPARGPFKLYRVSKAGCA